MSEIITVQDLETLKKHEIFEAEVLTGKVGGLTTGPNIDYATNAATGQTQKTMPAILRDIGFEPASFDFTTGGTLGINDRNKAVLWPIAGGGDGFWYNWEGALPKVIPPASSPASTGGVASGAWRIVGDVTLRAELSASSGASLVGSNHGGTVQDHLKTIINVDPFVLLAPRVIDGLHAARDYIASIGGGVGILSAKTYLLEDEYIPADRVIMRGQGVGPSWNGATILKWAGGAGSGKAVVRSSKYPLGTEGPLAFSGVGVQNCIIDADGCDVGLYCYYTINNSDFDNLVTRNALLANTYIIKSWFTYYGRQQVRDGLRKGLVIGKPLYGEVGDIAVNACWFDWIRADLNGSTLTAIDPNGLSDAGAGVIIGPHVHACNFVSLQSGGNYGVGLHTGASYANAFGAVYLEDNCKATTTGEKTGWINVNLGSYAVQSVQTIHLATNETIKNNVDGGLVIAAMNRGDNINSFTGAGKVVLSGSNLGVHSNTDWTKFVRSHHYLLSAQNINVRYSSAVQAGTRFISHGAVTYPFVTIIPRATVTLANPLIIGIGANAKISYGTVFTSGVAVTFRHAGITSGAFNIEIGGVTPTTDTFFDIYVAMSVMAGGGVQSPSL